MFAGIEKSDYLCGNCKTRKAVRAGINTNSMENDFEDEEMEDEVIQENEENEKIQIKVNVEGGGVRTLDFTGTLLMTIGIISAIVTIVGFIMYLVNKDGYSSDLEYAMIGISLASTFLPVAVCAIAGGAICSGLSTIARTALYKRKLMEQDYKFVEYT